jgi:hypothetical protein
MALHRKVLLPANNSAWTGEVSSLHEAIGEGNLAAESWTSEFQVVVEFFFLLCSHSQPHKSLPLEGHKH